MSLIYTIPQGHCVAITRFGKFARIQRQGLNFKIPFIEKIYYPDGWGDRANKKGFQIELSEQQTDTTPRQCHTKDNVPVSANASVYWRIVDVVKALYEADVLPDNIGDVALNALRSRIGKLTLDELPSQRAEINEKISIDLSDLSKKWGIIFTRVEVQELEPNSDASTSMVKQMDAEREKRAAILKSEGEAEAILKIAEAEKQSTILRSEGVAIAKAKIAAAEKLYLSKLKEEVNNSEAANIIIAEKYLSGFENISKNAGDKVFLPNNFNGLISLDTEVRKSS